MNPIKTTGLIIMLFGGLCICPVLSNAENCLKGSGVVKTQERQVSPFNAIALDGIFDVQITCKKKQRVSVTADDNLLPKIVTEVKGEKLHIYNKGSICSQSELRVIIDAGNIRKISANGAIDLSIVGIDNKQFILNVDGAGDIEAKGKTDNFQATLSGATELQANRLLSKTTLISINGSGDAEVHASKQLNVSIAGAGSINYHGNPGKIIKNIKGVGELTKE